MRKHTFTRALSPTLFSKPVATGTVKITDNGAEQNLTLFFDSPTWLHAKTLFEVVTSTPDGITTVAHP